MKSSDTLPELLLAEALTSRGLAFARNVRGLPGTPDFVFVDDLVAVFVHGCYWHRHHGCARARVPSTDTASWLRRFADNVDRDQAAATALRADGWLVHVAWECEILAAADDAARNVAQVRAAQAIWRATA